MRSPHRPEHTVATQTTLGLDRSGLAETGFAERPGGDPPSHTYLSTHKLTRRNKCNVRKNTTIIISKINVVRFIKTLAVPVGACRAALGMVALSSGTELVSGSGVLLLGEVGIGLGINLGFLCMQIKDIKQMEVYK